MKRMSSRGRLGATQTALTGALLFVLVFLGLGFAFVYKTTVGSDVGPSASWIEFGFMGSIAVVVGLIIWIKRR